MQNNEMTGDTAHADTDVRQQADKARGSFDLRHQRHNPRPLKLYLGIAGLVVFFIAALGFIWFKAFGGISQSSSKVDESTVVADATLSAPTSQDDSMKQLRAEKLRKLEEQQRREAEKAEAAKKQEAPKPVPPPMNAGPVHVRPGVKDTPPQQTAEQRKLGGGVMLQASVNDVSAYPGAATGTTSGASHTERRPDPVSRPGSGRGPVESPAKGLAGNAGASSRGNLNDLSGVDFTPDKASLAPPKKYLLAHGTYARCALYTEIVTEHPGIIDCRLTEPLYSADGSTVIAEQGDRLTGVQKVQMTAGQARVFTSWTELDTASGVRAKLASLGAGPMGASGTEAWIDNHYMKRYGGALMLSIFQDALAAASNSAQDNDSGYTVHNTEQNVESMAEKALDSTINIPPTAYILPGTVITVIVARDIDFSSVFETR